MVFTCIYHTLGNSRGSPIFLVGNRAYHMILSASSNAGASPARPAAGLPEHLANHCSKREELPNPEMPEVSISDLGHHGIYLLKGPSFSKMVEVASSRFRDHPNRNRQMIYNHPCIYIYILYIQYIIVQVNSTPFQFPWSTPKCPGPGCARIALAAAAPSVAPLGAAERCSASG